MTVDDAIVIGNSIKDLRDFDSSDGHECWYKLTMLLLQASRESNKEAFKTLVRLYKLSDASFTELIVFALEELAKDTRTYLLLVSDMEEAVQKSIAKQIAVDADKEELDILLRNLKSLETEEKFRKAADILRKEIYASDEYK